MSDIKVEVKKPIKKVLVTGSRDWTNVSKIQNTLSLQEDNNSTMILIHGTASGADRIAEQYALSKGWKIESYPADWNTYGKSAGPRRNEKMVRESCPNVGLVFWKGNSSGTKNCMEHLFKIVDQLSELHVFHE